MPLTRSDVEALVREDLGLNGQPGVFSATFEIVDDLTFEDRAELPEMEDVPVLAATFATPTLTREHYAMRWRFRGVQKQTRLTSDSNSPTGPTGNMVEFTGLTIVEIEEGQDPQFMRYIDWLSAYSQLGLIEMRRPSVIDYELDGERRPPIIGWASLSEADQAPPTDNLPHLSVENGLPIY
jgi:hypothetical protein